MSATEISAALVKELRDETGAGMMDCKRALQETAGDLDAAKRLLRERGMAEAGKRAGRETTEGIVLARLDGQYGTIVAVGCETEPVSKNEEFLAFAQQVLKSVERDGPEAAEELEGQRVELVGKIGENVAIRGSTRYDQEGDETIAAYVHPPANKIGVLVKVRGSADAARQLAMHISFAAPRFLTRDEVPAEEVENERSIYEKLGDVQSKPEEVRSKIVEGMLSKRFFGQSVLTDQEWIHESGKTVGKALGEQDVEVLAFQRYALGG
ncbi:MAG: translation elongation factor Ts [Actinobacteria bacterium]|nr:translation elongation factor Ts [Actinomycetota bacterium]